MKWWALIVNNIRWMSLRFARYNEVLFQTVNPLLSPGGELIYFKPIWKGGGLFNLETTMVSILHKELEYTVEKLKYKKF